MDLTPNGCHVQEELTKDENLRIEWQKMLSGEVYEAQLPAFQRILMKTRKILKRFNNLEPDDPELADIIRGLLGSCGRNFAINQPFRCDYGCNISVGNDFFANFNLTILDEALVTFGDHCFIGPNVSIYTACHPLDCVERDKGVEWAEPVTIGNSVWIGGNSTILPGVTIGDNCVIGAGSVVTHDIPSNSVAVGNPARVIRKLQ